MREAIGIHVGDVGCGLGRSIWKLLANEHSLDADGRSASARRDNSFSRGPPPSFFAPGVQDRWHPRAIFVGSDADASFAYDFDSASRFDAFFRKGALVAAPAAATFTAGAGIAHSLFYDQTFLSSGASAPTTLEGLIVKELERSERPTTFFITNDFGSEGLGSGAASQLIDLIQLLAPKMTLLQWGRLPSQLSVRSDGKSDRMLDRKSDRKSDRKGGKERSYQFRQSGESALEATPVGKLNTLLHLAHTADRLHFSVPSDLEAMSDLIYNKLGIRRALPIHFHDLAASTFVSFTSLVRAAEVGLGAEPADGTSASSLDQIVDQIVPARSMPYALSGISPLENVSENVSLNAFAPSFAENGPALERLKKLAQFREGGGEGIDDGARENDPLQAASRDGTDALDRGAEVPKRVPSARDLVWSIFEPSNLLLSVDPFKGRYGKACAIFRANAPVTRDHILKQTLQLEKHGVLSVAQQWIARSPRRIHAHFAPAQFAEIGLAVSSSFFGSNSAFSKTLDGLANECEKIVHSRSFLHAFEPQIGPDDWRDAIDNVRLLADKYKFLGKLVAEKEQKSRWRQHDVKFLWRTH